MKISTNDFQINNNNKIDSKYYTTYQYQEFTDDDEFYRLSKDSDKVFAKVIKSGLSRDMTNSSPAQYKYYVRGNNGKKLFDPFPKYSISDNKGSFLDKVCKGNQQFIEVTKSVFEKYITFLKTESNQYFISAQREIM
jgi:hypothetical protein